MSWRAWVPGFRFAPPRAITARRVAAQGDGGSNRARQRRQPATFHPPASASASASASESASASLSPPPFPPLIWFPSPSAGLMASRNEPVSLRSPPPRRGRRRLRGWRQRRTATTNSGNRANASSRHRLMTSLGSRRQNRVQRTACIRNSPGSQRMIFRPPEGIGITSLGQPPTDAGDLQADTHGQTPTHE